MRILVTGAAGQVGSTVARGLRKRHQVRGHDRVPMPELDDTIVSDLNDFDAVLEATRGMDGVAHIGGLPGDDEWEPIHQSNIVGTYNVFEACRRNGVKRVAFASRVGVLGQYPRGVTLTVDIVSTPIGFYTISKVFGESIAYSYAREHDMGCVCVRIGSFNLSRDQPEHPLHLSHGDCLRVFEQALVHPNVTFAVVFGVSDSNWPLYDLEHGRQAIGYCPQDRSLVPEDRWN
ncbi:MAG TPA: NAD(P)-dependent oxidoreductase [Gammaproteobacteria bacterium]|nr:NAD(P)-dependent oxidoreductase [Gammaproteobacteria bacterium]